MKCYLSEFQTPGRTVGRQFHLPHLAGTEQQIILHNLDHNILYHNVFHRVVHILPLIGNGKHHPVALTFAFYPQARPRPVGVNHTRRYRKHLCADAVRLAQFCFTTHRYGDGKCAGFKHIQIAHIKPVSAAVYRRYRQRASYESKKRIERDVDIGILDEFGSLIGVSNRVSIFNTATQKWYADVDFRLWAIDIGAHAEVHTEGLFHRFGKNYRLCIVALDIPDVAGGQNHAHCVTSGRHVDAVFAVGQCGAKKTASQGSVSTHDPTDRPVFARITLTIVVCIMKNPAPNAGKMNLLDAKRSKRGAVHISCFDGHKIDSCNIG